MRLLCKSIAGRVCEVRMLSPNDCQKFKCKRKARAIPGGWCAIFPEHFSSHFSVHFSTVESSILKDPTALLHCPGDP